MEPRQPIRILYMEDDPGVARLFQRKLERLGYQVAIAADGETGLAMHAATPYDIIALDHQMPVYDGLQVLRILTERGALPSTIMVTGSGDERIAVEAMKLGAEDYLIKDADMRYLELLPSVLDKLLARRQLVQERAAAFEVLRLQALDLQARNEELDAYAHTVAHDLKNPLTTTIGYAQFLRRRYSQVLDERALKAVEQIEQSGVRMQNIIDELLLLAHIRAADVEPAPLAMARIVAEAQDRLADMIQQRRAKVRAPDQWPETLGYESWVREVWVNYLSNALKYGGDPPLIEVGGERSANGFVRFWVRDNGAGITAEQRARLFTPFTRLDQIRAEGHGLGLSIVRRIVEKLGGAVDVESEPGKGSVFSFTLPSADQPQSGSGR